MSFIGEEGGKGGRSSNGREEEVRKRLEEGRRADDDGRRADEENGRRADDDGRKSEDDGSKRFEDGRRANVDGRRANDEKQRAGKRGGRSNGSGRSQASHELIGRRSQQKSGREKINLNEVGGSEVATRKDDRSGTGGGEQLRRVPYLQVKQKLVVE